jgi:hypothetical protein
VEVLYIDHAEAVSDPPSVARKVNAFLNDALDVKAMASAVDPSLHRQRS